MTPTSGGNGSSSWLATSRILSLSNLSFAAVIVFCITSNFFMIRQMHQDPLHGGTSHSSFGDVTGVMLTILVDSRHGLVTSLQRNKTMPPKAPTKYMGIKLGETQRVQQMKKIHRKQPKQEATTNGGKHPTNKTVLEMAKYAVNTSMITTNVIISETKFSQSPAAVDTSAAKTAHIPNMHFIPKSLLDGKKLFIYQRNQMTGFGSVMLTFFVFSMYFQDTQNRTVHIFDDTFSQTYRKSKDVGLAGFLDFNFPVLNIPEEYDHALTQMKQVGLANLTDPDEWATQMWNDTTGPDYPILRIRQYNDPRYFSDKRGEAFKHYRFGGNDPTMFQRLSKMICDSVRFKDDLVEEIQATLQQAGIPDYANISAQANQIGQDPALGPTVAFHVRRGDKVYGKRFESKLFLEDLYVEKLMDIPDIQQHLPSIQHCYVATDEYNVTVGLRASLEKHNVTCQLHFLVPRDRDRDNLSDRRSHDDTRDFFTELYLLSHATYFVGTFNSNVGAFVAPFRGCKWQGNHGTMLDRFNHFYGSYGVDRQNWFIRK
jgi:hypothetical protein